MASINTGKVIVGGLLAGVVMNAGDMLQFAVLFKNEMDTFAKKVGIDAAVMQSGSAMATFITCDFLMGIFIVWNYALARPRLGPGPKSAVISVLPIFLAITGAMFGMASIGLWPMDFFIKSSLVYLVVMIVASVVGAWAYKEV